MKFQKIKKELKNKSNKKKAKILQKFFKTGKGEYGEGDLFIGVTVPEIRKIAKNYDLELKEIKELLKSKVHEERQIALIILVKKYENAKKENNKDLKKEIFEFYLNNLEGINNWDLVDVSCPKIIGDYLIDKKEKRNVLYKLAGSCRRRPNCQLIRQLWERRIAIVSTFAFIRKNDLKDTFALSKMLLEDEHDLTHKATGWMLREAGKRNENKMKEFLKNNYEKIPRTTLRYAIERIEENERKKILSGKFN